MKRYIGIDIGKKRCDVCVVNHAGKVIYTGQYANTKDDTTMFARDMASRYGTCSAACESTASLWRITFDAFEKEGIHIKLANTYQLSIISKTAKKTDKIDAEKIAQILRMNMIPQCYVPDVQTRELRNLIRQRIKVMQDRTRVINRIHSMLDIHDFHIDATNMYGKKGLEQLDSMQLDSYTDSFMLKQHVCQLRDVTGMISRLDDHIRTQAAQNKYAVLLTSMTGIGTFSALLLAAEIADISRFSNSKKMVSWAGLCPTVHQSGDTKYSGRIKKTGRNSQVNWIMCEAANVARRYDSRMEAIYLAARKRHADKHGPAIIVVANKMLTIMWHMLMTETPYESRNEDRYLRKLARMKATRQD